MNELIKILKKKYNGIRYSNLINGRKQDQWWFTIPTEEFLDNNIYLMLIHERHENITVLHINSTNDIPGIIPRKGQVHLSGQYDLYFILENDNSITMKYLSNDGYKTKNIQDNIIETLIFDNDNEKIMFIENLEDLQENLLIIESYLGDDYSEGEKDFALSLIQKGKNMIAYKVLDGFHFAPSRFVGYKKNDIYKHKKNSQKDGRKTTPVINRICIDNLHSDISLEEAYLGYCRLLNINPDKNERQYWLFDFTGTSLEELANNNQKDYKEGQELERKHKRKERSRKLVEDAKSQFRQKNNGEIFCEICGFNFMDIYGIDYIEVHHLKAIADMKEGETTNLKDVCLVCPNCHRVIHRKYPCLTMEEIKKILIKLK